MYRCVPRHVARLRRVSNKLLGQEGSLGAVASVSFPGYMSAFTAIIRKFIIYIYFDVFFLATILYGICSYCTGRISQNAMD